MRIAIDARFSADHFPGIGRYIYNLVRSLAAVANADQLLVLYHAARTPHRLDMTALAGPNVTLVPVAVSPFSIAAQWSIPLLLRRLRIDLFHAPYYLMPYIGMPCPLVVTLYDVIPRLFPHEIPPQTRLAVDLLQRLAIRRAVRIITISQSAAAGLRALYGIAAERISVTPLAADPRFAAPDAAAVAALRQRYALPPHFALSLSSNKPHKNLETLIEAWQPIGARLPLLIAGQRDPRYDAAERRATALGIGDAVRFIGEIAEAALPVLYGAATLFLFPSLYEGFGLPPLEAMACGTPVICGNHSSLPEVVGDAAHLVDVRDSAAISHAAARILADPAYARALREAGIRRAASFGWQATAADTWAAYQLAMTSSSAP
ncbi:MAG TPA: glycosyltransferase family 1 protein [Roseiflexaceae bacterium]|nr:glycosyltransferase family 1 protein [Roseiflexaceae bacterium]